MKLNIEYKNVILCNDFKGEILLIVQHNLTHFKNLKITESNLSNLSIDIDNQYFWRYFYRFIEASFNFITLPPNFDIKNVNISIDEVNVLLDIL